MPCIDNVIIPFIVLCRSSGLHSCISAVCSGCYSEDGEESGDVRQLPS